MQCQHETPVLEIHGPRLIVLSNLIDPSVPRSHLTIKFSWMTNIWLLKKLSTLWQTTPAGWVHYFSLPCLPAGSSVSSFLFMLGNSLEAPCFKNNPLAATPGDGWIAGANGCTGLMPVEVAFCLESSVRGVLCFSSSAFWKEFHAWCVKVQKCLRKGPWNELPPAIWPGRGKSLWYPGCVWHQAFPGRLARHGFMIAIPKQWCSQRTLVLLCLLHKHIRSCAKSTTSAVWFHHGPIHCTLTTLGKQANNQREHRPNAITYIQTMSTPYSLIFQLPIYQVSN